MPCEGGAAVIAITYFKLYVAGEVLTASDLNSSLSYITTNAITMISPLTGPLDVDGNILTMDSDADSTLSAVSDDILKVQLQSVAAFYFDGSVAGVTNGMTLTATATGVDPSIAAQGGDTNIGLKLTPKGIGVITANGTLVQKVGADVASAASLLVNISGNEFDVTGTVTITSFATKGAGTIITLQFDGALILTHHATNLILPAGRSITTAAGDIGVFWEYEAGKIRCVSYQRAAGAAPTVEIITAGVAATYTPSANAKTLNIKAWGGGGGSGGVAGGVGESAISGAGAGCGFVEKTITTIAASYTYTVGVAGAAGAAGNNDGTAGAATTFTDGAGVNLSAGGGAQGLGQASTAGSSAVLGAIGGAATGGDVNYAGGDADGKTVVAGIIGSLPTSGSAAQAGGGIKGAVNAAGTAAINPGQGGGSASQYNVATNRAGAAGFRGQIVITTYY